MPNVLWLSGSWRVPPRNEVRLSLLLCRDPGLLARLFTQQFIVTPCEGPYRSLSRVVLTLSSFRHCTLVSSPQFTDGSPTPNKGTRR